MRNCLHEVTNKNQQMNKAYRTKLHWQSLQNQLSLFEWFVSLALKGTKMGAVDYVDIYIPGSESRIADFSRPFASSDEKGDTTCNKTV